MAFDLDTGPNESLCFVITWTRWRSFLAGGKARGGRIPSAICNRRSSVVAAAMGRVPPSGGWPSYPTAPPPSVRRLPGYNHRMHNKSKCFGPVRVPVPFPSLWPPSIARSISVAETPVMSVTTLWSLRLELRTRPHPQAIPSRSSKSTSCRPGSSLPRTPAIPTCAPRLARLRATFAAPPGNAARRCT